MTRVAALEAAIKNRENIEAEIFVITAQLRMADKLNVLAQSASDEWEMEKDKLNQDIDSDEKCDVLTLVLLANELKSLEIKIGTEASAKMPTVLANHSQALIVERNAQDAVDMDNDTPVNRPPKGEPEEDGGRL